MPNNLYRRGRTWHGRIQVNGRELRKSLHTTSRTEANERLKDWKKKIGHAAFYGEERHTYAAACGRWAAEYLPGSVKPNTAKRYLTSVKALDATFGKLYLDEIDRKKVAAFVSSRIKQGVTNATIRRDLSALSSILHACMAWTWRDDNPAHDFNRSIIKEMRDPIVLPTDEDIEAIIEASPPMLGRLWRALRQTGMREGEGASLEWGQIPPDGKRRIILTKTKTSRPRVIPLDDKITCEAVGTLAGTPRHITSRYVFWHYNGERYTQPASAFGAIRRRVNRARRMAGKPEIHFRVHDLRHKFAVDYLRAGGNIYTLQQILGHASIKTTELYLDHLTPDEKHTAKYGAGTKVGTDTTV